MRAVHPHQALIFLHIPKTAGSTLIHVINNQYRSDSVLAAYASRYDEELNGIPRYQLEKMRLITGHFYFGLHRLLQGPSNYLTMLRNPVDRIISHYHFVKNSPDHYLFEPTKQMSLQEYVMYCDRLEPNNDQTRLLAGIEYASEAGEWSPEMLPAAKKNLHDHFAVVGITEEFDRSLLLMKRNFGWRTPFYIKQNVTRNRPRKEEISEETLRVIRTYNELDFELYRYGKDLFLEKLWAQGDAFENELRMFRVLNTSYNRVYRLVSSTAGRLGASQT